MNQLFSVGAILLSTLVFLMGNGLTGTLLPVRAHLAQFSDFAIGLMGSAYFVGFIVGCYAGPRLLARVGHSRTFAAAAGLAAAATLMQSLAVTEFAWVVLRGLFGLAAACVFMVIESWLNDRASNETRGRVFALYLLVNFSGLIVGQWFFITGRPSSFTLFSVAAIFYALCLIPVGLTQLPSPSRWRCRICGPPSCSASRRWAWPDASRWGWRIPPPGSSCRSMPTTST